MSLTNPLDFILHIDEYLGELISSYGLLIYPLLFLIIFLETGLVITPFLPGDSLLFGLGAFAANGAINLFLILALLMVAAILGDTVNYWIGNYFGEKVFAKSRFFKKEHLEKTKDFYKKYGGKTIIIARFVPIVRTFAPFVAGIGKMNYRKFLAYNIVGGVAWVTIFLLGGYFFGSIPIIKNNLSIVTLIIIFISIIPIMIEFIKAKRENRTKGKK